MRRGLRELAAARLLAEDTAGGAHRPRHALLAEAVAAGLLPGERAVLHERTARALQAAGDDALAAEVAGHWQAAGRPAEELPARVAAAAAAERVFGYAAGGRALAAGHRAGPSAARSAPPTAGAEPALAVPAGHRRGRAIRRHPAAPACWRRKPTAGSPITRTRHRRGHPPARRVSAGRCTTRRPARPLLEESLRLFELGPPSAEHAEALSGTPPSCMHLRSGWQDSRAALQPGRWRSPKRPAPPRVIAPILAQLAGVATFMACDVEEGFATLQRGRGGRRGQPGTAWPLWQLTGTKAPSC